MARAPPVSARFPPGRQLPCTARRQAPPWPPNPAETHPTGSREGLGSVKAVGLSTALKSGNRAPSNPEGPPRPKLPALDKIFTPGDVLSRRHSLSVSFHRLDQT